jgi:CheY-like chemotaxis protein
VANLLIVDDDGDLSETCAEVLRAEGHAVRQAENGQQGLDRVAEQLPDLILCDVEMPVLSGPDMAYRMLVADAGREKVPLLLISGLPGLGEVAREVGTPYVLGKPFTVKQLTEHVAQALAERIPPRPRTPRDARQA